MFALVFEEKPLLLKLIQLQILLLLTENRRQLGSDEKHHGAATILSLHTYTLCIFFDF